jgi:hypothetical protein
VLVLRDAVRYVDETKPPHRVGGRFRDGRERRDHRIQQGQRQCGTHAAKEGPPGQRQLGDDHDCDFLIWNGMLLTMPTTSDENR